MAALRSHFNEPLTQGPVEVVVDHGGDDALARFIRRRPDVVVITATLETGDARSMVDALRAEVPRGSLGVVLLGDEQGPVRTALDALDFAADRFVAAPVSGKSLRFAVGQCLELVATARKTGAATQPRVYVDPSWGRVAEGARSEGGADAASQRLATAEIDAALASPEASEATALRSETASDVPSWQHSYGSGASAVPEREPTLILGGRAAVRPPDSTPPLQIAERGQDHEPWQHFAEVRPVAVAEAEGVVAPVPSANGAHEVPRDDAVVFDTATRSPPAAAAPLTEAFAANEVAIEASPRVASHVAALPVVESGSEFAAQLRAKMSQLADRLFAGAPLPTGGQVVVAPTHGHDSDIDVGALAHEPALPDGATELMSGGGMVSVGTGLHESEGRAANTTNAPAWVEPRERSGTTPPGLTLGSFDVPSLILRCHRNGLTGRLLFRIERTELVLYFDEGRPVFAGSNQPSDRMGKMLCREGKITPAQLQAAEVQVGKSGRRMGETLVDLGFLKRRELLPAVRRHLEDLCFAMFGLREATYAIIADPVAVVERIRLARAVATLVVEGIRRKYDAATLARLGYDARTAAELLDREKTAALLASLDAAPAERAAVADCDGVRDVVTLAALHSVPASGLLALLYGLSVLGLCVLRGGHGAIDEEIEEGSVLVGAGDLAIDRARVLARAQLVAEADYFALLGVRRDATSFEIQRAFDTVRRDFAAEAFAPELRRELADELRQIAEVIDEALWVLGDDTMRGTYLAHIESGNE